MNGPIRSENAEYKTINQIMELTNLSRGLVVEIATYAEALIKIGKVVRIDERKFRKYLVDNYTVR